MVYTMKNDRYREPICKDCINRIRLIRKSGRIYEIDCKANPNLGGVTAGYDHCCSYRKQ